MSDLARRLVEHPRWPNPWPKPMVDSEGLFVASMRSHGAVPDLNHPATKGWLLEMLREAWGAVFATDEPWIERREHLGQSDWLVTSAAWPGTRKPLASAPTEGEALAAALLAVWGEA